MSYLEEYYAQTPGPGQEFGAPRDNGKRTHQGADFSHSTKPGNVDVPIVETGTVTGNYWSDGYGWRVEIGPWSYSHLDSKSPLKVGETYQAGTIAGTEGDTGSTFGSCMHVEYVSRGKKVDPVPVIRSTLGGSTAGNETEIEFGVEMYIIEAEGRTPALIGPGFVRTLNEEEVNNISAIASKRTTINARQYDLCVSAATTGTLSAPPIGAYLMVSPNRKLALVDTGFFREFNSKEEADQAGYFATRQFNVNDRQYDLARSIAQS